MDAEGDTSDGDEDEDSKVETEEEIGEDPDDVPSTDADTVSLH